MMKVLFVVIAVFIGLAISQPFTNPLEIITGTLGKAIGAGVQGATVVADAAGKAVGAGIQGVAGAAGGAAGVVGAGVAGAAELAGEAGKVVSDAAQIVAGNAAVRV